MNLQTIPRKDKVIKRAFVPKLDALLFMDYSQIELTLLAFYMSSLGDPSMAEAIIAGKDLHDESARGALGITGELTDEQRQVGKTLNFALTYGGGTPTVMRQLGVSFTQARKLIRMFHERWPGIAIVQAVINSRLDDEGYIKTLFGRQLHPESQHKALNALVQGCAADLMRNALVTIDEELKGWESHLINVVHDEVQIDAIEGDIEALAICVPPWMDYAEVSSVVPITVSCEISRTTWADKQEYREDSFARR